MVLTYTLEGDAYEALTSMTEESQNLQYIINYFAKVRPDNLVTLD